MSKVEGILPFSVIILKEHGSMVALVLCLDLDNGCSVLLYRARHKAK